MSTVVLFRGLSGRGVELTVYPQHQWIYTCTVTMCPRGIDSGSFNAFIS